MNFCSLCASQVGLFCCPAAKALQTLLSQQACKRTNSMKSSASNQLDTLSFCHTPTSGDQGKTTARPQSASLQCRLRATIPHTTSHAISGWTHHRAPSACSRQNAGRMHSLSGPCTSTRLTLGLLKPNRACCRCARRPCVICQSSTHGFPDLGIASI